MDILIKLLKENKSQVQTVISDKQDWQLAYTRFNDLFKCMANPTDKVWNSANFDRFKQAYFSQKEKDKGMSNIITRTLDGMKENDRNLFKIIFLQIAEACCVFNASHKVNFESKELPDNYDVIKMIPAKSKGMFTYANPTPSIYKKTSLTFDYWVPKFLEWTDEIRIKKLKDWKGEQILAHECCTDFMRICLLFLSDTSHNPPIAKAENRAAILTLAGIEFEWMKKSAKRENITSNNAQIVDVLSTISKRSGIKIPLEAWSRVTQAPFIKTIIK